MGAEAGGVYVALKLGEALAKSVPQPGEQEVPAIESVQVTPRLDRSFCSSAWSTTAGSPA